MEIIDGGVEIFAGAVGFFDFESVEGFGMDDANNFAASVGDRKLSETRLIEFVENKRTENLLVTNKRYLTFGRHEIFDVAFVETHDGGNTIAVLLV